MVAPLAMAGASRTQRHPVKRRHDHVALIGFRCCDDSLDKFTSLEAKDETQSEGVNRVAVRMRQIRVWAGLLAALMGCLGGAGAVSANDASREIAERLAGAMRFETISYEHASDFRGEAFDAHEAYLRENYPRTHAALHLEKVNGYTLLFKWPGSDPTLKPGLFMSHTDVVPVEAVTGTAIRRTAST